LVGVTGSIPVLWIFYPLQSAIQMTRPSPNQVCCVTPADAGLAYETVTLVAEDQVGMPGWYIPSHNSSVIILLHGYGGNRLWTLHYAEMLARHGYGALLYDQRASGESQGDKRSYGWQDAGDFEAAVQYLRSRDDIDPERIGILGCSTGAEIAIAAAARFGEIGAVVADAPFAPTLKDISTPVTVQDWLTLGISPLFYQYIEWLSGVSPEKPLSQAVQEISPRPLLLISTGGDYEKRQADMYYNLAGEPKTHWNIPEAYHCGGPEARYDEYEQRITTFFDQAFQTLPEGEVSIPMEDGVMLSGEIHGKGLPAVILANGGGGYQEQWQPLIERLTRGGYTVLTFDYRGSGRSGGEAGNLAGDMAEVVKFMRWHGYGQIVCMGASMGGASCTLAAHEPGIAGLVLISSVMPAGFHSQDRVTFDGVEYPVLFMVSANDPLITGMQQVYDEVTMPRDFVTYTGGAHGTALLYGEHSEEVIARIMKYMESLEQDLRK